MKAKVVDNRAALMHALGFPKLQRGDVVEITLTGTQYTFKGIITSATKRYGLYVITRSNGHLYRHRDSTFSFKLLERRGKRPFSILYRMSQELQ